MTAALPPFGCGRRVCIAGAGAVGLALAARLALAGEQVSVLARGATLDAIRREGLSLSDLDGTHQAWPQAGDRSEFGVQDAVFLCAKSHDLGALAESVAPLIGPATRIVPVVNGIPWWYFQGTLGAIPAGFRDAVDPGGRLAALLPPGQIVASVTYITAERSAPNRTISRNPLRMIVGAIDQRSGRAAADVAAMLNRAGIATELSPRVRTPLWTKVVNNLASNPLSVVTGATLREIFSDPALCAITRALLAEALAAAEAYGAQIAQPPEAFMASGARMGDVRTSMLQDYDTGRPLELAAIGDAVVALAAHKGIAMPRTRDILDLARFKVRKTTATATDIGDRT